MLMHPRLRRIGLYGLGALLVAANMGQRCGSFSIGSGGLFYNTVIIELVNETDYDVDPYLYVSPEEIGGFFTNIATSDNEVIIDPLIAPDEVVTIEYSCDDVGTVMSDRAIFFLGSDPIGESVDSPVLVEEDDFECGDTITFYFGDDGVEFFTEVAVNDLTIY